MLPPHDWDDDVNRLAIHSAFDIWFMAHMQGNRIQARRWRITLRTLTDAAKGRERTVRVAQACAHLGLDRVHVPYTEPEHPCDCIDCERGTQAPC